MEEHLEKIYAQISRKAEEIKELVEVLWKGNAIGCGSAGVIHNLVDALNTTAGIAKNCMKVRLDEQIEASPQILE